MSAPKSTIYVCSGVRLDPRYEHSIYFENATAQQEYFAGKVAHTFSAYSYLRKSWPIQVDATMEQAKTWSYLFFRNGTGKFYYYFITNVEYKSENSVLLTLELDVLQTYLFDFDLLDCFVERQHTTTDGIGEHTLDEGLEVGDLKDLEVVDWEALKELCILVLATFNPNYADTTEPVQALSGMYDGVFSGLKVWAVSAAQWQQWGNQLDNLAEAGFLDGIISMWMYPKALVRLGGENTWEDDDLCKTVEGCQAVANFKNVTRPTKVDYYEPRNNKLLCYPYNFLYVSNNSGGSAVFRYERFITGGADFKVQGSLSPDAPVKMWPVNYNGITNYEQGLTLGAFPACAWDADVYKMWLAQNQNQQGLAYATAGSQVIGGAVAGIASLATGNLVGVGAGALTAVSGAHQIAGLLAQKADMAIQPPQSRGSFSANVNVTAGKQTFTFYKKTVTAETARVLDDYFTMYGYKLNRVQKPNIHARPAFTYIKTVGCHIQGAMCTEDVTKIETIFDHGITFWVNGDKVADYSQNNTP